MNDLMFDDMENLFFNTEAVTKMIAAIRANPGKDGDAEFPALLVMSEDQAPYIVPIYEMGEMDEEKALTLKDLIVHAEDTKITHKGEPVVLRIPALLIDAMERDTPLATMMRLGVNEDLVAYTGFLRKMAS